MSRVSNLFKLSESIIDISTITNKAQAKKVKVNDIVKDNEIAGKVISISPDPVDSDEVLWTLEATRSFYFKPESTPGIHKKIPVGIGDTFVWGPYGGAPDIESYKNIAKAIGKNIVGESSMSRVSELLGKIRESKCECCNGECDCDQRNGMECLDNNRYQECLAKIKETKQTPGAKLSRIKIK